MTQRSGCACAVAITDERRGDNEAQFDRCWFRGFVSALNQSRFRLKVMRSAKWASGSRCAIGMVPKGAACSMAKMSEIPVQFEGVFRRAAKSSFSFSGATSLRPSGVSFMAAAFTRPLVNP